eukprot:353755-Chlamydomonas_euryale.AAC.4
MSCPSFSLLKGLSKSFPLLRPLCETFEVCSTPPPPSLRAFHGQRCCCTIIMTRPVARAFADALQGLAVRHVLCEPGGRHRTRRQQHHVWHPRPHGGLHAAHAVHGLGLPADAARRHWPLLPHRRLHEQ